VLHAGIARVDITPPLPIDLVGYSRRWEAATEIRAPLTATALVLDGHQGRVAIVAADVPIIRPADADLVRIAIGTAIDAPAENVLLNVSHTHGGPHTHTGGIKIGGDQRGHSDNELAYIDYLPRQLVAAAQLATHGLTPVRVAGGAGSIDLNVNRRERNPEGRMILGWDPDGVCDRDVGVLRFDREDGSPLAIIVNYACHPVVVGPEDPAVNPDYPGPMRALLERVTGATCLFLQGAAGNVLPLEGFFDHSGPERTFGERLAVEALHVADRLEPVATDLVKEDYGSVTPISLYRHRPLDPQPHQPLVVASRVVAFPLKPIPSIEAMEAERQGYLDQLEQAAATGAGREILNPIEYHLNWADDALRQRREGGDYHEVPAFLQAIRIGDSVIAAVPGEVFSEMAVQVKERSSAATTLFAGYSNGVVSYLPTAASYPAGGYECDYAHHSYGLIEQVAPETERIVVDTCVDLIDELFG